MTVNGSGVAVVGRRRSRAVTVLAAIVGVLALALSMVLTGAAGASAQEARDPDAPATTGGSFEFSPDGVTWSEDSAVLGTFSGGNLSPGRVITREYFVRNADSVPGTFEVFIGNWTSSSNSLFTVQSDFGADIGVRHVYYGSDFPDHTYGPAVEVGTVLNSVELAPREWVRVVDAVGLHEDAGNETQRATVSTAIEWRFTVPEPEPEPEPGECQDVNPFSGLFSAAGSTGGPGSVGSVGSAAGEPAGSLVGIAAGSLGSSSFVDGCAGES